MTQQYCHKSFNESLNLRKCRLQIYEEFGKLEALDTLAEHFIYLYGKFRLKNNSIKTPRIA
jgi:hypothetical protein